MNKKYLAEHIAFGVLSVALLVLVGILGATMAQRDKMYKILVSSCEVAGNMRSYCERTVDGMLNISNEQIDEYNNYMRRK